ncbi:hypothetical protein THAOC_28503, partial [Thalassiosira oceanica]
INGKTCVADEYLPGSNQYKVTLETKSKEVLGLSPDNLKRRDRTPQDCGYYIEFKNDRTIRHDFDSNEDCQAFVAALINDGETQPAVTDEAEAAAEQAAAELLAELGLDDSPSEPSSGCKAKKSKKKKGGKKKKTKDQEYGDLCLVHSHSLNSLTLTTFTSRDFQLGGDLVPFHADLSCPSADTAVADTAVTLLLGVKLLAAEPS